MTNADRYKTPEERADAFERFCNSFDDHCHGCPVADDCSMIGDIRGAFAWLDLEAEEEKLLPCPFCGGECIQETKGMKGYRLFCEHESSCGYVSSWKKTIDDAVAAHNRVAKAVMESEVKK